MDGNIAPDARDTLSCSDCGKSFGRHEHLKRHTLTHTRQRQFKCQQCGKDFLRRDALQRHELLHETSEPSLLQKGARACKSCAGAKVRCDGAVTCSRCLQRSTECRYPRQDTNSLPPASQYETGRRASFDQLESTPSFAIPAIRAQGAHQPQDFRNYPDNLQGHYMVAPLGDTQTVPWQAHHDYPQLQDGNETLHQSNGAFEAEYWNPGVLSTINWLSNEPTFSAFDPLSLSPNDSQFWSDFQYLPFTTLPTLEHPHPQVGPRHQPTTVGSGMSTVSTESPADSATPAINEPGQFYVDGNESRLPRVKRRKIGSSSKTAPKSATPVENNFSFADWPVDLGRTASSPRISIPDLTYQSLQQAYALTCTSTMASPRAPFRVDQFGAASPDRHFLSIASSTQYASELPPKEIFEHLVGLYIDHFSAVVPIIHHSNVLSANWQLVLAISALGSHYLTGDSSRFVVSMHEFVRRGLHIAADDPSWLPGSVLEVAQVKLLHAIGMMYSGDERLQEYALKIRLDLTTYCERLSQSEDISQDPGSDTDWTKWTYGESVRRTAYAIWLLDSMTTFHFDQRPLLDLQGPDVSLPCHERLWAATHGAEWKRLSPEYTRPPTVVEGLRQLYIEKILPPTTGEFSRIILIYGIMRRTWDVEAYFRQPLSRWSPTAQKQASEELNTRASTWLPSVPTYTKWRNSACDCLDILHWSANAAIGAASGMEHSTVIHLHLARVVLLTPYKHIVNLAQYLAGEFASAKTENALDKQMIRRWATQDQYKARLAMIHAGVMFWHVRRFSANGFYETSSVALAALVLWAFSAFSTRPRSNGLSNTHSRSGPREDQSEHNGEPETDSSQEDAYDIILLDRPTDDELVQQFVRRGDTMKANMNGVGDLYGERGPEKVLLEGRKLLNSLGSWGIRDKWIRVFDNLITVTRQQRKGAAGANARVQS